VSWPKSWSKLAEELLEAARTANRVSQGAVVDDEGAKLGADILKRHKNLTERVVKIHDDRFWADIPAVADLSEVPAAVLRWYDQCRSDRWHQRTAAQRQDEAQHQQQVS